VDNEESKQKVGINIPYSKGSSQGVGVAGTPFQTENFDRRDLLVELSIKPHISIDDTVLLEIKHDAEDLFGESAGQPTWTKRSLETRVVVRSQQTVVVGGMMQERDQVTTSKVPLLGDLDPRLPVQVQAQGSADEPAHHAHAVHHQDQMDLQLIHERKTREHQEFVASFKSLDGASTTRRWTTRGSAASWRINRTLISIDEDAARAVDRTPPQVCGPIVQPRRTGEAMRRVDSEHRGIDLGQSLEPPPASSRGHGVTRPHSGRCTRQAAVSRPSHPPAAVARVRRPERLDLGTRCRRIHASAPRCRPRQQESRFAAAAQSRGPQARSSPHPS
jgi:general secretion pathway protein D